MLPVQHEREGPQGANWDGVRKNRSDSSAVPRRHRMEVLVLQREAKRTAPAPCTRCTRWVILVAMVAVAGCATGHRPPTVAPDAAGGAEGNRRSAELVLTSRYPGPVTVHAASGALRVRLATVTAHREARVVFPPELVGRGADVHLLARPVGGGAQVRTEGFRIEAGDRVFWTLLQPLESSIATLRVRLGGR